MVCRWLGGMALGLVLVASLVGTAAGQLLQPGTTAPEISGGSWINSEPLSLTALRGRVVLIDFWTYG